MRREAGSGAYGFVLLLLLSTMSELTFTGSKSLSVRLVRHLRSSSFQRVSGVPMRPPVSPLSARMIPYWRKPVMMMAAWGLVAAQTGVGTEALSR